MHLCLRCLNINKRIWYSRKDECRKAPTGIQRCQFLCVFMHVYTQAHLAVYNTQGEKVAMRREGAGSMKKKKKMYFLSSYHGKKRNLQDMSRNVRELQLLYYPTLTMTQDSSTQMFNFCKHINASFTQRIKRTCKILVCM